jgi:LAO/AO transport system kinase
VANHAAADLRNAVHLLRPKRPGWEVDVRTCSARTGAGIDGLWAAIVSGHHRLSERGELDELRAHQATSWMWSEVTESLLDRLRHDPSVRDLLPGLQADVAAGRLSPSAAADRLLDGFEQRADR